MLCQSTPGRSQEWRDRAFDAEAEKCFLEGTLLKARKEILDLKGPLASALAASS